MQIHISCSKGDTRILKRLNLLQKEIQFEYFVLFKTLMNII